MAFETVKTTYPVRSNLSTIAGNVSIINSVYPSLNKTFINTVGITGSIQFNGTGNLSYNSLLSFTNTLSAPTGIFTNIQNTKIIAGTGTFSSSFTCPNLNYNTLTFENASFPSITCGTGNMNSLSSQSLTGTTGYFTNLISSNITGNTGTFNRIVLNGTGSRNLNMGTMSAINDINWDNDIIINSRAFKAIFNTPYLAVAGNTTVTGFIQNTFVDPSSIVIATISGYTGSGIPYMLVRRREAGLLTIRFANRSSTPLDNSITVSILVL